MKDIVTQRLKRQFRLGNAVRCLFFAWDDHSQKVIVISPKKQRQVKLFLLLSSAYVLLQLWSVFRSELGIVGKTESSLFITLYVICLMLWWDWKVDTAVVGLLNYIISKESKGMTELLAFHENFLIAPILLKESHRISLIYSTHFSK